jgi:hypothetical protein
MNLSEETYSGLRIPGWRPWRELAVLGVMVMELTWMVPWYRSLSAGTYGASPVRVFLVLGSLMLSAHLVVRLMNFLYLRLDLRRVILAILLSLSFLVGLKLLLYGGETIAFWELINRPLKAFSGFTSIIPDEFVVAVWVLIVVWRGLAIAQARVGPVLVKREFQLGVIMFVTFVFINTLATGETPGSLLYVFLFAGLVAMGSARISVLKTLRGGENSPFDRRWLLGIVAATLMVVGLAAVVANLTSDRFLFVERIITLILRAFAILMAVVIAPVVYLMLYLLRNLRAPPEFATRILTVLEGLRSTLMELATRFGVRFDFLAWLANLRPYLLWGFIFVIGILILAGVSRWWLKELEKARVDHQTILGPGDFFRLFGEAMKNRFAQLAEGLANLASLRDRQRWLAAARIRRIYIELMELSEELDVIRAEAQTPLEFLPVLRGLFPGCEEDLNVITQAYLRVRYGELPETRTEVDQVESAWERVNLAGNQMRTSKKRNGADQVETDSP